MLTFQTKFKRPSNSTYPSPRRRKRADLIMLLKILTMRLSIEAMEFYDVPLTRCRGERLRLYPQLPRSQVRSNFFTYLNLNNLKLTYEGFYNRSVCQSKTFYWSFRDGFSRLSILFLCFFCVFYALIDCISCQKQEQINKSI